MRLVKMVTCCRCGETFQISADKIPAGATRRHKISAECPLCGQTKVRLLDESLCEMDESISEVESGE